jgi:hypothetical protein
MLKVRKRVEAKAAAGTEDAQRFKYIPLEDMSQKFRLFYANDEGFHQMDFTRTLGQYSEEMCKATKVLYMKILSLDAILSQSPKTRTLATQTQSHSGINTNSSACCSPSPTRLRKRRIITSDDDCDRYSSQVSESTFSIANRTIATDIDAEQKKDDMDILDTDASVDEITHISMHEGYISRAQTHCPYSGIFYQKAMKATGGTPPICLFKYQHLLHALTSTLIPSF